LLRATGGNATWPVPGPATRRLLASYYLYQATVSSSFFAPVFVVYYQQRAGLDVATVLWLESWALFVRGVLDLPFGALADRWSRRACLEAGALGSVAAAVLLLAHPTLAGAALAETLFAAAAAMRSGADSAFLYDTLDDAGALDVYARAESRGQAVVSLSSGATAVAGGLLAAVDLRLPYVAAAIASVAGGLVARRLAPDAPARRLHGTRALMREAAGAAAAAPAVRWSIALAAFAVVGSHVYFYLQQPYLEAIGVPVAAFGLVFAATKGVTAVVAASAHRVDRDLGPLGTAVVMAGVPALGLGAMSAVASPAGAVLLLSRGVLDGLWQPLTNVWLNRLVPSRLRATMLSLQSLVARLALGATLALLGAGVARGGIAHTLALAAAVAAAGGAALVAAGARVGSHTRVAASGTCDTKRG